MDKGMKKRWISLYVENQVGVLSKINRTFFRKDILSITSASSFSTALLKVLS